MENVAIAGAKHPPNAATEGYVLNRGILPLHRVEAVPSDFDAAKPDVPLFRAPLSDRSNQPLWTGSFERSCQRLSDECLDAPKSFEITHFFQPMCFKIAAQLLAP